MKARSLLPILATAGILAVAVAPSSAAASPQAQEAVSANWAGYVVGDASSSFSSVSGSWVEPTDDCTTSSGDAAFWVGLGGTDEQSQSLEQIGTEADCGSGGADYFAWYELVPSAPVKLDLALRPGDHVSARVSVSGTDVTVSLTDQTTGASVTKTLPMSDPDTSSAEWIAEAPSMCGGEGDCQPLPLADFGTVTFTGASATAGGHTGTISDSSWTAQPVQMSAADAGAGLGAPGFASEESGAGASPASLSSDGSSFSVSWSATAAQTSASSGSGDGGSGEGEGEGEGGGYGYGGGYGGGYGYGYGGGGYGGGGYGGGGYGGSGYDGSGYGAAGYGYPGGGYGY
jgi:hypothetical protein